MAAETQRRILLVESDLLLDDVESLRLRDQVEDPLRLSDAIRTPKNPRPARHANRPSGQPVVTVVREDRRWKVLSLPPPLNGDETQWMELVESTVERSWDRWCYAQHQAIRAARLRVKPLIALALARAAWDNYWLLAQDAERIRARLAAETSAAHRR